VRADEGKELKPGENMLLVIFSRSHKGPYGSAHYCSTNPPSRYYRAQSGVSSKEPAVAKSYNSGGLGRRFEEFGPRDCGGPGVVP
jgi:hypothetical protein